MTATFDPAISTKEDADSLAELGYTQELHRGIGGYAAFASGLSFVSILTTVFDLFALGFGLGWPAIDSCCLAEPGAGHTHHGEHHHHTERRVAAWRLRQLSCDRPAAGAAENLAAAMHRPKTVAALSGLTLSEGTVAMNSGNTPLSAQPTKKIAASPQALPW